MLRSIHRSMWRPPALWPFIDYSQYLQCMQVPRLPNPQAAIIPPLQTQAGIQQVAIPQAEFFYQVPTTQLPNPQGLPVSSQAIPYQQVPTFHQSAKDFYDRFYSVPRTPTPPTNTLEGNHNVEAARQSDTLQIQHSSSDSINTKSNNNSDVEVVDEITPPVIDLTETAAKYDMKSSGSTDSLNKAARTTPKRQRKDSGKSSNWVRKQARRENEIVEQARAIEITDDPAVVAVGPSESQAARPMDTIAPGVLQFLGGNYKHQNRYYHHQATTSSNSTATEKARPFLNRQWTTVEDDSKYRNRHYMHFSIASYNVLAQNLIEANGELYGNTEHELLVWKHRKQNLLKEMKYYQPDVMCLQEVQNCHFEEFYQPKLKELGYDGVFKCRTGDKQDGCATFFKTSKFTLDCYECVEYRIPHSKFMDRDNVGIVVRLSPVRRSRHNAKLVIGNTHLLFNPRRGDIKLAQLQMLLTEMERMAYDAGVKFSYHSTVLCGDMNAEPHCDLYRFLTRNKLEYNGLLVRNMAGQQQRGRDVWLGKSLLPRHLGVTDNCQYAADVTHRTVVMKQTENKDCDVIIANTDSKSEEGEITSDSGKDNTKKDSKTYNQPELSGVTAASTSSTGTDLKFGSGILRHPFRLRSVYSHDRMNDKKQWIPKSEWEVSTHHSGSTSAVDYIFYSCHLSLKKKDRGKQSDAKLKLTAKLDLLNAKQMEGIGHLPNEAVSSDHLLIMAKFALAIS